MRTLAIDLGARRVGLALSDDSGKFATPIDVLQVATPTSAVDPIVHLIEREHVRRVVIGLPLNMDGTSGPAARAVIQWAKLLRCRVAAGLVFVDERLSSFAAEQQLSDRRRAGEKLTRGKKKQRLDAIAAAGFLQEFLDGKLHPIDVESKVQPGRD